MTQNGGEHKGDDDAINANLKRVYDDMLNQEVPDRFKDLLKQLKSQDNSSGNADSGDST
ncbi:NepR family anti-sigma factor [Pseudooctadecabacter sp.]|uniref:NepR family anti-sigma factor n=1 Tax=Pseudooctadecabacter sp. TaxID=1966338 RepID=UPI0035C85FA7